MILNTDEGSLICLKPVSMESEHDKDIKLIEKEMTSKVLFEQLQSNPNSYFLFDPNLKYKFCKNLFEDLKAIVQKHFFKSQKNSKHLSPLELFDNSRIEKIKIKQVLSRVGYKLATDGSLCIRGHKIYDLATESV